MDNPPMDLWQNRLEWVVSGMAFLLPTIFSPLVQSPFFMPKFAILLVLLGLAAPFLPRAVRESPRVGVPAVLFLGIAALSTLLSQSPALALFGQYGWGTGWLFVAALVAAWAVGTQLTGQGRARLVRAILAAGAVSAAIALPEMLFDLSDYSLGKFDGRAFGLTGNPVHLAALLAGAVALAAPRLENRAGLDAALLILLGAGLGASGGRLAITLGLAAALTAVRRIGVAKTGLAVLLVMAGMALGTMVGKVGEGATVDTRIPSDLATSGLAPRAATWWSTRHAVADSPLLGEGPGRFRSATIQHRPLSVARYAPDTYYLDAHNILVEYAVTTGLLGVTALVAWLATALWRGRGPLLAFALVILASHLLQPQSPSTTPLAFLAIGAAMSAVPAVGQWARRASVVVAAIAVFVAGTLLAGDYALRQARLDSSVRHARRGEALLPAWPDPATFLGRVLTFHGHPVSSPARLAEARQWLEEAARRDPTSAALQNDLGEFTFPEDLESSEMHFRKALSLDPWSVRAMTGLAAVYQERGHLDAAAEWFARAHVVSP